MGKQIGSGSIVNRAKNEKFTYELKRIHHLAKVTYQGMIDEGIAPEQARMVLPQSMYTSYYVTGSLAAWARMYRQRIDPHAQVEIQDLAKLVGGIIEPLFPISWHTLVNT